MRVFWGVVIFMMAGMILGVQADETADSKISTAGVTLVCAGQVDPVMLDRVSTFAMDNTGIPIHIVQVDEFDDTSFDTVEISVADKKLPEDLCVVVLMNAPTDSITSHGVIHPEKKIAVVNAKALKPADGDQEKYGRRLEKQTIRSMAMLFGLGLCPNPHCALWSYQDDEQLDLMGRNLCPPCHRKLQNVVVEEGIILEK